MLDCLSWSRRLAVAGMLVIGLSVSPGLADDSRTFAQAADDVEIDPAMLAVFQPPLPDVIDSPRNPVTDEKVDLGRMLFFEERLSLNHSISCNSCHQLDNFGVDNEPASPGHVGQLGDRTSPTVYNVAGHFRQFWDGRADTIEEQAMMPVTNPVEMAMPDDDYVLDVLRSIPGYVEAFEQAFPDADDPITVETFGKALGAFQRVLTTPSPWDEFLAGNEDALTNEQKQGFKDFVAAGCMACHMGTYIGGNMFQKLGVAKPWPSQEDQGRYEVTGDESDRMMFKSASLRNIEKTSPYFHDGSVEDLDEAVRIMAEYQLGRELTDQQVDSILAWFSSLTGEIPEDLIEEPDLPESGPDTPGPVEEDAD